MDNRTVEIESLKARIAKLEMELLEMTFGKGNDLKQYSLPLLCE